MVEIFDTHDLRTGLRSSARSIGSSSRVTTQVRRALVDGALEVDHRPVWDLARREVVALDAVPALRGSVSRRTTPDAVWSIAEQSGAGSDLVRSMRLVAGAAQRAWAGGGLQAPVAIARSASSGDRRGLGRRPIRAGEGATVSFDLIPEAASELYGLQADRAWRVHMPVEEARAQLRRCADAGVTPASVRLSATLVCRFTRDGGQLRRVARCIEAARHGGVLVHADGAHDGEVIRGLTVLGCHRATGLGFGPDLRASEVPMLRWASSALSPASDRLLRAAAG